MPECFCSNKWLDGLKSFYLNFNKSYLTALFLTFLFLNTNDVVAQCGTGAIPIDLSADPDEIFITPEYVRNEPGRCITFSITLNPAAVGIQFSIASGASPAGALTYSKDCGPAVAYTELAPICLTGVGPHIVTFCKPGANPNAYRISSVPGVVASSNSLAGSNSSDLICEGGTLNLTASTIANATYSWTGPNGFNSNLQNPTIGGVSLAASGTYAVAITTAGGCTSPLGTTEVAINPTPSAPIVSSNGDVCAGQAIVLNASSILNATYAWTGPNGFTSNLQNPVINNSTVAASGTYSVVATVGNCSSPASSIDVLVNPIPVATATPAIQTICSGNSSSILLSSNVPSTTFAWTVTTSANITGASNGTGSNITQALTNTGTTAGTANYTIFPTANGCTGNPLTVTLTINPTPEVLTTTPSQQTICSGSAISIPLNGSLSGTNFTWTVLQNGVTGASSGSGNTISQILSTTGQVAGTAVYTVTPVLNNCNGSSYEITINVNPRPLVNAPANFSVCPGASVPAITFTSDPAGASYTWTNNNTDIGLAASGSGSLPSFIATNTTSNAITATITISPTSNGCTGIPSSFTITVYPLVTVVVPPNATYCEGSVVPSTSFSSFPAGATFSWTNSNTSIGLAASGTGNIPSFTAANSTGAPLTAIISVTPILNGCAGTTSSYSLTINPLPVIISATKTDITACGVSDGTITITATGTAPLTYSIDGGVTFQNANVFTSLAAGSYAVVVSNNLGCLMYGDVLSISIPVPPAAPPVLSNSPVCEGDNLTLSIDTPDPTKIYNWSGPDGYAANGSSVTRSGVSLLMAGNYAVTATDIATNCVSAPTNFTIQVKPLPIVSTPSNFTVCNGATVAATSFSSTPGGATYEWSVDNINIGLPSATGNGDIPAFTATNSGTTPITGIITVVATINGCEGPAATYEITVNPTPTVTATPPSQTVCSGAAPNIELSSNIAGTTFSWSVVQTGVSGATAGTGNVINQVITAVSGTAVYTITPFLNGCEGVPIDVTITVNPVPVAETTIADNQEICSGSAINIPLSSNVSGTTFSWIAVQTGVSGASNGTGSSIVQTLVATGPSAGTVEYTITPTAATCNGEPIVVTVVVKPLPTVNVPANLEVCPGATISPTAFSSIPTGATYNWTNSNPAIGLVASGGGNVPGFVATNNTNTAITATITVTPTLNGCDGPSSTYTITVKPLPQVILPPTNIIYSCVGSTVPEYIFSSDPSGATYTWTNSNTAIGLPASGTDRIPSFTARNTGSSNLSALITVTPFLDGCAGPSRSFTITIRPLPVLNVSPSAAIICSGSSTTLSASGAQSYFWFPSTGLSNTSSATVIATPTVSTTYTVVGTDANGCTNAKEVRVVVNPPVLLSGVTKAVSCRNGNDGELQLNMSGGTAPYRISYRTMGGTYSSPVSSNENTLTIGSLTVGTYEVRIADVYGCFAEINSLVITEPNLLTATSAVENSVCKFSADGKVTLTVSGGTAPYSYNWTNFSNNAPVLSNIPSGNYNVTITDANNCSIIVSATVLPGNCAPIANNDSFSRPEDSPINEAVINNDNDVDGDNLNYTALSNPSNGSFIFNNNGTFVFTPSPNWNGTTSFDYRVCDPAGLCDSATVTLTITAVNDPPVANDDSFSTQEDVQVNGSVILNDSDVDGDILTYTRLTNPANGTLVFNSDGTFIFTPNLNWNGTTSFEYRACDNSGLCDNALVTIVVSAVNDPPVANNDSFTNLEDTPINGTVVTNDNDPDGNNLTFTNLSVPANGTFTFNSNGSFTFIPNSNWNGTTTFDYQTCDPSGLCDIATVTLIITPVNDVPIANDDNFSTLEDNPVNGSVIPNDSDPDGDVLTYTRITNPANGTLVFNSNGTFVFTPNLNWNGTTSFEYRVCDPFGLCDNALVTIVVSAFNDPPVANPDLFRGLEDAVINGSVIPNDSDPDGDNLVYTQLTNPANGTLIFNTNGTFVFTPNLNWNGTTTFNYQICDPSNLCSTATVTIIIVPVNDPPVANPEFFNAPEDTSINGSVIANDSDPDGDTLTFSSVTNPANGTITFNSNGSFTFIPNLNWTGSTSFNYQVCDPFGLCDTSTVNLTITPVNDPPLANPDRFRVLKDSTINETVIINDSDPEDDFLTYRLTTNPANGNVIFSPNGDFNFTPNLGYTGIDTFIYEVCDPFGLCDTSRVTLLVQPRVTVNLIPQTGNIREGEKISITAQLTEPLLEDVFITLRYTGTAENSIDYILEDRFITLRFIAGDTLTTDFFTINAKLDALKEDIENVIIDIETTSSTFVIIGTGSDITITDVYPESKPIGPDENPDINPDPLISPNDDGFGNDSFIIYNIAKYPDNEVIIFNRWGNEVFRLSNYNNEDRAFKGIANTGILTNTNTPLVDGVYYFLIYTTDSSGVKKLNKGYIILKR